MMQEKIKQVISNLNPTKPLIKDYEIESYYVSMETPTKL